MVVTGAEHKHYFDRALKKRKNTVIHNLQSLTIEEKPIEEERIQKYRWIRGGGFTLLLHGPDMDFHPYRIPGENIQKAIRLLKRLEKEYGHMPDFVFEQGWVDFLKGNYDRSISRMQQVITDSAHVAQKMKYLLIPSAIRTQAYCHDLKGNRQKALELYSQARATALRYGNCQSGRKKYYTNGGCKNPIHTKNNGVIQR